MNEAGSPPSTGGRLGAYELGPLLAAGGMGEVYRAHDTRLGRDVAIKILPPNVSADPERLARFEREARVLARLNHPNIASIFGIEDAGDYSALVLELVDGETLAATIERGAMPLDRFFDAAIALADAVAAAHDEGVTHRDLKPTNVMVRPDGRIKVLDFGIAKLRDDVAPAGDGSATLTEDGRVLGTAAYMSPEQAAGQPVDQRSDIFSLGAVLYEMATGARPFRGATPLAQVAAVLTATPSPPTQVRADLPAGLDAIVGRALDKDLERRYPSAQLLRDDLEALRLASAKDGQAPALDARRRLVWSAGVLVAVGLAIGAAAALGSRSSGPGSATVIGATQVTFDEGIEATPALSPDGRRIAYEREGDIFIRDLVDGLAVNLTPDSPEFDGEPAFSPDGSRIAFSSRRDGGQVLGGIWLVDVNGGPARRLTNVGFSPAWSPDGQEVLYATEFVRGVVRPTSRVRISALGAVHVRRGITRRITDGDAVQPAWSPNGHRILFWRAFDSSRSTPFTVMTMRPDGTDLVPVTGADFPAVWNPVWSPDGAYVYFCTLRDGSEGVWRVAIDEESGQPRGEPQVVPLPALMVRHIALSGTGDIVAWEASRDEANVYRVPFDPRAEVAGGEPVPTTSGSRLWRGVDVSTEGRLVVTTELEPAELWVSDATGAGLAPLLPDRMHGRDGRWSPDGERIAFTSVASGTLETWMVRSDGTDLVQVSRFGNDGAGFFPLWSADGAHLAITTGTNFGGETFLADPSRPWQDQTLVPLRPAPGDPSLRYRPWSWSPDGRSIAAYSERGAGIAVYSLESDTWEIITERGTMPRWLGDSRRLVFADDGRLFIVDTALKQPRVILAAAGASLNAPALMPGDTAIYSVRTRLERDIWMATLR